MAFALTDVKVCALYGITRMGRWRNEMNQTASGPIYLPSYCGSFRGLVLYSMFLTVIPLFQMAVVPVSQADSRDGEFDMLLCYACILV